MCIPAADAAFIAELEAMDTTNERPAVSRADFRTAATYMLMELLEQQLTVILTPSRISECAEKGGMIRTVVMSNPVWYRQLCDHYPAHRKKTAQRFVTLRHVHQASSHAVCAVSIGRWQ